MSQNETFKILFFSLHFQSESSGFSLQNGGKSRRSQIDMRSFLIKTLLDNTYTPIVYEYILLVYCIIFAKQNFFLLLSEDRGGILSFLNRVRRGFLTSFSIGNNTWNSSGISIQNGGQSRRFQIDMLSFLNIKKKDNIHTPK